MKALQAVLLGTMLTITCGWSILHGNYKEANYVNEWAAEHGGVQEYRLDDATRVDILTSEYAIEVDYAPKWAEAIGQSLYYASKTGRAPAILLIVKPGDQKYVDRVDAVSEYTGKTITVMKIKHK